MKKYFGDDDLHADAMHDRIMFNVHSRIYKTAKSGMHLDLKKESSHNVLKSGPGLDFTLELKHGNSEYNPTDNRLKFGAEDRNSSKSDKKSKRLENCKEPDELEISSEVESTYTTSSLKSSVITEESSYPEES